MKLVTKKILAVILSVFIFAGASVFGASAKGFSSELDGTVDFLVDKGTLASEGQNADWLAVLLAQSGRGDLLGEYAGFVKSRIEKGVAQNDMARTATVCAAMGIEADFVRSVAENSELDRVSELIWRTVITVDLGEAELVSSLADQIEAAELAGGGYALSGEAADPDLTAMAICALKMAGRDVDELIDLLSSLQNENGSFSTFGVENAESCAQVIIALSVCGLDAKSDQRFIKNGISVYDALLAFSLEDGGFAHTVGGNENRRASVQAALALLSLELGENTYKFGSDSISADTVTDNSPERADISYKPIAIAVCLVIAAIAFVILLVLRRLNAKNAFTVGILAAAAVLIIIFTNIQTPEQYYAENPDPIEADSEVVTITVIGDGEIIETTEYALREGESALDLLLRSAKYNRVSVDASDGYVRGIGGLYEFDRGQSSGWLIFVNGEKITSGADSFILSDGDRVEWRYSEDGN